MRRKRSETHPAARTPQPSRRIHSEVPGKLPEQACCPGCGASYRKGRWTWKTAPADAYEHTCPACERIASGLAAGVVRLEGAFARSESDELIRLLRNIEERERGEHPLKRIMDIATDDAGIAVTVTDPSLAESFGRALRRAYEGRLEQAPKQSPEEGPVRILWERD